MDQRQAERTLKVAHQYILRHFAAQGRPPTEAEVQTALGLLTKSAAEDLLAGIEQAGAIYRDPASGAIVAAYPFSAVPTEHRLVLAGGQQVYAMCAVDALGTSAMLGEPVSIRSVCHHCGVPVTIDVDGDAEPAVGSGFGVSNVVPAETVVWYADPENCCVAATEQCPHINFFCGPEHRATWRAEHPAQAGRDMALEEALARGIAVFGHLLQ